MQRPWGRDKLDILRKQIKRVSVRQGLAGKEKLRFCFMEKIPQWGDLK